MKINKIRGMSSEFKRRIKRELAKRDGMFCGICKFSICDLKGISIDHVVPLKDGGSNDLDNLQLAHVECNLEKDKIVSPKLNRVEMHQNNVSECAPIEIVRVDSPLVYNETGGWWDAFVDKFWEIGVPRGAFGGAWIDHYMNVYNNDPTTFDILIEKVENDK